MSNADSNCSGEGSHLKRASNKGFPSSRLNKCKLAIALVALTLIAQLFTASTALAYSCGYGLINPTDDSTALMVNLEIDGVELDVVRGMHVTGHPDGHGRTTQVRKIYQMKHYTESFTINISQSTEPYIEWKNMDLTDLPYSMVTPSLYNASTGGVKVRVNSRSLWDKAIEEGKDPLIDPIFGKQAGEGFHRNYPYTNDPTVLPTDINPGPFEHSFSIYNPVRPPHLKHYEAAMLCIEVRQGFELLELVWDERWEEHRRVHMDSGPPRFYIHICIIIPDPGDAPLIPTKIFPENGSMALGHGADSSFTFSWNTSSNADRYQMRLRSAGGQWQYSPDDLTNTHATANGFPNDGRHYEWAVRAGNSSTGRWSDWSSAWTFYNGTGTDPTPPAERGKINVGLYDPADGVFHLEDVTPFRHGPRNSDWLPLSGDWNGDGNSNTGLYDQSDGVFHLSGPEPFRFGPRNSDWLPVAGDWNRDGRENVGLYDPSDGVFHLRGETPFRFGPRSSEWLPVSGGWNGDGYCSVGLYDPSDGVFHLSGEEPFRFGPRSSSWPPLTGDWNGNGKYEVGLYDLADGVFHLKDIEPFRYGPRNSEWLPVSGKW